MGHLIQVALHGGFVSAHCGDHSFRGRPRRSEQRFDQTPRLFEIQHDALAGFQRLYRRLAGFREDETADRLAGHGRSLANDGLVFGRNPGDEALALLRFRMIQRSWHGWNVHQSGTQVNWTECQRGGGI